MSRRYWLLLSVALGLGLVIGLMTITSVAGDPIPGKKVQIPRIDVGDVYGTGDWETWIQVQNVGITRTGAIMFVWGDYAAEHSLCPTNDCGPIGHYCMLIEDNALWTVKDQISLHPIKTVKAGNCEGMTLTIRSAIVYSVDEDAFDEACDDAGWAEGYTRRWREWKEEWESGTGEISPTLEMTWGPAIEEAQDLAVVVNRSGPNDFTTTVSSAYTGVSEDMEGYGPSNAYYYYAPYVMLGYMGLDTEITIQNSGQDCTSIWIEWMEQGTCVVQYTEHIEALPPGESIRIRVPHLPAYGLDCPWLGSAQIRSHQPLGIIIDQASFKEPCPAYNRGTLLSARLRPKGEIRHINDETKVITDTAFYADLLFREWSGWTSSIQVQNLSPYNKLTFVTVDFMDASGNEVFYVADWICSKGGTTFYLPAMIDFDVQSHGLQYIGSAEIQSHRQISAPNERSDAEPIFVLVDLKRKKVFDTDVDRCADVGLPAPCWRPTLPGEEQGGAYNAHPFSQKVWQKASDVDIALPFVGLEATGMGGQRWTSWIAIRNNSNCNKIQPFIKLKDEVGRVVCEITGFWLHPKAIKLIDLANVGCITGSWFGAARVKLDKEHPVEQLCDTDGDGSINQEPIMLSAVVVEKGVGSGDVVKIYEGIPVSNPCYGDVAGTVKEDQNKTGIDGAIVEIAPPTNTYTDTTDANGDYLISMVPEGSYTATVTHSDYLTRTEAIYVPCRDTLTKGFDMRCKTNTITGTATISPTGNLILGTVAITFTNPYDGVTIETRSDTTGSDGKFSVNNLVKDETLYITVSKDGYDT
ncbi:MAG: carboxypeptidase regulatory-like domain-containing protein, partial [Anaerolineae bacterium]